MKTVIVGANDAGQRLDKFLSKTFRGLPSSLMYKAIRKKDIKRNGKRCQINDRLEEGDILTLYLHDEVLGEARPVYDFLTASRQLDIVYEDDHVLLLNKKAGLLVHPDEHEYRDTLITRVQRYLYEKGTYDPETGREHPDRCRSCISYSIRLRQRAYPARPALIFFPFHKNEIYADVQFPSCLHHQARLLSPRLSEQ